MKHLKITVQGRVQGVFYRASTRVKADDIGVKGFVRNQADGSVYIEAEGSHEQLEELVSWCKEGPRMAQVSEVNCIDGKITGFSTFEIER